MPSILFRPKPNVEKLRQLPKPRLSAAAYRTNQITNMITTLTAAPGTVAISDDEMRRFAPSVSASQPIEGVSERYSFLPTSSILNGMRENGWVPVRALEQSIRTEARRGFQKHMVRFARVERTPNSRKRNHDRSICCKCFSDNRSPCTLTAEKALSIS